MNDRPAVFGFPDMWNDAFKDFANVYTAIDTVQQVAADLIKATQDDKSDVVEVLRTLKRRPALLSTTNSDQPRGRGGMADAADLRKT